MNTPAQIRTIRSRGALSIRSDGLYLHGHYVEDLGLTAIPSLIVLHTNEANTKTLEYVQASDVLFVLTGLESVPPEQTDRWRAAYLYARNQLSEIVEICIMQADMEVNGQLMPILHPVTQALFWIPDAMPFFEKLREVRCFLNHLTQFPIDLTQEAQVFVACLIAQSQLGAVLDSFDEAHLSAITERVIDGKSFLEVIHQAQRACARIDAFIIGNKDEPMALLSTSASSQQAHQTAKPFPFVLALLTVLGILAWWGLRKKHVHLSLEFRWYDLWRGVYIRPHKPGETTRHLYWCPIRCLAIHFEWPL